MEIANDIVKFVCSCLSNFHNSVSSTQAISLRNNLMKYYLRFLSISFHKSSTSQLSNMSHTNQILVFHIFILNQSYNTRPYITYALFHLIPHQHSWKFPQLYHIAQTCHVKGIITPSFTHLLVRFLFLSFLFTYVIGKSVNTMDLN